MIQIEVPGWTLNKFASICLRVVEREFGNEVLLEYLSLTFRSQTHIYIGPSCLFKLPFVHFQNGLKRCVFSKSFFWNSSLVIDYRFLVIDYTVIFWRVMTFQSFFWSVVAGNRLQTSGNWLRDSKFKFKTLWMFVETTLLFDSTLASSKPCIHTFTHLSLSLVLNFSYPSY